MEIRQEVGQGEATGLAVDEVRGNVTVVHGHVLEVRDPSPEFLRELGEVAAVRTQLPPGTDLREVGVPSGERLAALEAGVDEILDHFRAREARGEQVDTVQAGTVTLSRVDLLLKQATLLRADADQLFLEAVGERRDEVDRQAAEGPGPTFQLDAGALLEGMDWERREANLREALALVQEADRLAPGTPEVLLHLAELTGDLGDDPPEEQRILYRARALLDPPRTDTDRFHLARTTLLLAMAGDEVHAEGVRNARDLFQSLGRADWVRHCERLLGQGGDVAPSPRDGTASPTDPSPAPDVQPTGFQPSLFQPVGQWEARISNGGAFHLTLLPGGGMHGSQRIPPYGMEVPFQGQWGFDAASRILGLQGLVGAAPFALGIRIDGDEEVGYQGVGSDGLSYGLRRIGR